MLVFINCIDIKATIDVTNEDFYSKEIKAHDVIMADNAKLYDIYLKKKTTNKYLNIKFLDKKIEIPVKSIIKNINNISVIIIDNKDCNNILTLSQLPMNKKYIINNKIICDINKDTNSVHIDSTNIADLLNIIFHEKIWISCIVLEPNGFYLYTVLILEDGTKVQLKIYINQLNNVVYGFISQYNNKKIESLQINSYWTLDYVFTPNIDVISMVSDDSFFALYYLNNMQNPILLRVLDNTIKEIIVLNSSD